MHVSDTGLSKHFGYACIISFYCQNDLRGWNCYPQSLDGDCRQERSSSLPQILQLVRGRGRMQTRISCIPKPELLPFPCLSPNRNVNSCTPQLAGKPRGRSHSAHFLSLEVVRLERALDAIKSNPPETDLRDGHGSLPEVPELGRRAASL